MTEDDQDAGLRDLLTDAVKEAKTIIGEIIGVKAPAGDDGYLWRWSIFYLILAFDFADSAGALCDGRDNRALLVLRRVMFEHMIRLKFFRQRPDIARAHLDDFTPRARLFEKRLADGAFHLIPNPAFDEALHDPQRKYRNFELVLSEVVPNNADDLYAQFYQFPSALIHGDALASIDILEMRDDGTFKLHGKSRRDKTDEVLFNYVAFFVNLLQDATAVLNVGQERVALLRERMDATGPGLGIEMLA